MDPSTCLYELLQAIERGDALDLLDHLEDLTDWVCQGGFLPEVESFGSPVDGWTTWFVKTKG